jgi:hypothetical protein
MILIFCICIFIFDFYKGQKGTKARPISNAANFIKFAEGMKTMQPGI